MRDVEIEVKAAFERIRGRIIDKEFVSQELLDVVERQRLSSFPWRGQFTPDLVGILLDTYGDSRSTVLDPFAGSGTTLAEATRHQMAAIGAEINPAALELARIFTMAELEPTARQGVLEQARQRLMDFILGRDGSLFGAVSDDILKDVVNVYHHCQSPYEANIIAVAMMLAMGDKRELEADRLDRAFAQVADVIASLSSERVSCSVHLADARKLPIHDESIDLIITSPPYINVFNYHQNYRPAIESLGWDVLSAAKTEIGSNRKHRQNRFLTVTQYAIDMMLALQDFRRVCRPGAHVVVVIGRESRVRGVSFANGEIVGCLAEFLPGIEFVRWQERSFSNRFGERIYEEVMTFEITSSKGEVVPLDLATETGRQLLIESRTQAEAAAVSSDIETAIEGSGLVRPSAEFAPIRGSGIQMSPRHRGASIMVTELHSGFATDLRLPSLPIFCTASEMPAENVRAASTPALAPATSGRLARRSGRA